MALDDGSLAHFDSLPSPPVWTGEPRAKFSQKPIIIFLLPTSGVRSYYQLALLLNIAESLRLPVDNIASLWVATSGGGTVSALVTMPNINNDSSLSKVQYLDVHGRTANAILDPQASGLGAKHRYSLQKAETLFHNRWGDAPLADAKSKLALLTFDSNARKTFMLTNVRHPNLPDTSQVRACDAVASTMAIPRYFKPKKLFLPDGQETQESSQSKGMKLSLYDGYIRAAFPFRQAVELGKFMRSDTRAPIYVLAISSGYDPDMPDRSRFLAPLACQESCTRQKINAITHFNIMASKGEIHGLVVDEVLAHHAPGISESPFAGDFENIGHLQMAADRVAEKIHPQIRRDVAPLCGV